MKVLSVGGGSGGHVTPVLAVINELSEVDPDLEAVFVCDKAFESQSRGLMEHAKAPVEVQVIAAGKLRRYHGVPLWRQLLDVPTVLLNIRDIVFISIGFVQSLILLARFKPHVVFAKGGYVCLPMGYAAKVLGIPVVVHDSDTRPGLTNTLLSRFAARIATGSPIENYPYPESKTTYTGVPIDPAFHPFTEAEQRQAKHEIGIIDLDKPLIVVTGGGLGARSINNGTLDIGQRLIEEGYAVYHISGKRHYTTVKDRAPSHAEYHVVEFVYKDMATVLGAADLVISRASATFLQELAALKKPTVIVPAKHLGDQVKNAEVYRTAKAAFVLNDDAVSEGTVLYDTIASWRSHPEESAQMAERFYAFAKNDAARDVARLIKETARRHDNGERIDPA